MTLPFSNKLKFEYKITITYIVIGFLWIFFSDKLLDYSIQDNVLLSKFQTYKGTFYIFATATLLFYLVRRHIRNLKKAEGKHKESEERYKALFFENNSVMLLIDPETSLIADANNAALEFYGYSLQEITSLTIDKINILPLEEIKENMSKAKEHLVKYFNFKHKLRSGEIRDVEVYPGKVVFDNKPYIYSIVHDITEKKRNEIDLLEKNKEYAALNEEYLSINEDLQQANLTLLNTNEKLIDSEAQFRLLVDNAPEPIFIQTEQKFAYLNLAALKLYGATDAEQLLGTYVIERIHPDFHEQVIQRIKNLNEKKEAVSLLNYKHVKLDNSPINVEVLAVPFTYLNKNGALVFVRDITERIRIENEIKQRTEEIENFFNCAIDLMCVADIQGYFIRLNKEWENLLGYPISELEGHKFLEFVHPDDLDSTLNAINLLSNQIQVINFTNRYRCKDGSYKWIEWKSYPWENKIYAAARDITDRLQKNLELIEAKEKAEESDSLKSAFLQNISHEVRTPLNAIVGFSQLITIPDQLPEKYNNYAKLIANSSEKLIDIITDVIEISQIHSQQIKPLLNEVEIVSFVKQTVSYFNEKAEIKNIEFRFDTDFPYKEYYIQSDSDKLRRIITHLIDNAIKFTAKGSIEIKCKLSQENFIFSIKDTGIGISEEMQKVIFEPFRQVETKISRNFGGNGLGLTIVKAFTQLLKGNIELHSEINKGTHITITIPVVGGSTQSILKETILRSHSVGNLLIAEDEYSNYQYLVALLEDTHINILYAENGQQAVDICRSNSKIDLILMDIKMPIMDGKTAAGLIKAFRPNLPIIAQTAYALDHEIEKYIGFDFDDYITKPIRSEELRLKMLKYL